MSETARLYTIHHDPAAHRLTIVTHGFWTPAVTAAFAAELLARGTAARLRHGAFTCSPTCAPPRSSRPPSSTRSPR